MKHVMPLLVGLLLVAGCTEPDHARGRDPAQALQADPTHDPFLVDAPSYQVREAIRSAALEVRGDRVLYQAVWLDPERAAEEERARPDELVAAHRAFPFHARLRLTHRDTGARVEVLVVDASPFIEAQVPTMDPDPRIAVAPDAARQLGVAPGEEALVWVEVLAWAP
jgi:rare lipoprotein A (peptidoglycan hydrolase)